MRNKIVLFLTLAFVGFSFSGFSQRNAGAAFARYISPDSLRNFDESAVRVKALQEGLIGLDVEKAVLYAKRSHVINTYYPPVITPSSNSKILPSNFIMAPPCVNEGFEMGNFTGWTLTSGQNTLVNGSCFTQTANIPLLPGPTATVLTTPLVDPVTGVLVPNSPLGGSMVARINDSNNGWGVTKLTQNFLVTNSNYLLDMAYFAVQNGVHVCCEQPSLFFRLKDCVGIPVSCPNYTFNAPSGLCVGGGGTWLNTGIGCPQCVWRSNGWQRYSFDLTQYIGTCITIEVMAIDCSQGGHWLYSYFDSNCNTMNLTVNGTNTISMPTQTVTPIVLCGTTATLTAPSGLNPYLWNGPPLSGVTNNTNQTISTSVAGNYTLVMTPQGVCNPIFRIINLQFAPPTTVNVNPPGGNICGGNATLTASGATNYTWMPGGSNSPTLVVSPSVTTIYTLTSNTGSCTGTTTTQITVSASPTINISSSSSTVCGSSPTTLTATGATNYTWSTGATGSVTVVSPTTTTTYSVVGTTTAGCQGNASITIFVVPTPTSFVTVVTPTMICIGQSANLFASALGALTYTWLPIGLTGNFVTVSPTITTQYTVVAANGGCTNSAVATLSVDPGPTMTVVASPTSICPGQSSTLSAVGAVSYTWNPMGTVASSVVVNPTVTTTYSVVGSSTLGCPATKTIAVNVIPAPTVVISPATPSICFGSAITLTASGAISYTWNPGGLNTATIALNPTVTTSYTAIGSNGSCTSSTSTTLTVVPIPTVGASSSSPTICLGSTATLTGNGATSYTWNPGGLTGVNVTVSPLVTTNYTVTGSSGGCTSTAVVGLTVITGPTITANANPTAICAGGTATLSASGALGYTWNPGALPGGTVTVSPGSTTNYSVTGNNIAGCTTTQTVNLVVDPLPVILPTANPATVCSGGSSTLSASGASTYVWNPGALPGASVVVNPLITTNYTVVGTSSAGCVSQTTVDVMVVPTPTLIASVNPTAVCNGASATLSAIGGITYTWNPGALSGATVAVTPTATTLYTVTGGIGGCLSTTTVNLIVNPNPTVTANANPSVICIGGTSTLTSTGATSYTWMPGVLPGGTVFVTPIVNTNYTVTGSNGFGCTGTAVTSVTVNTVPILTITASPTAICNGFSSTLSVSGATSYTWNPGAIVGPTIAVSPTTTTIYTVTASNGGCTTTGTIQLIVNPTPTVTASVSPTTICSGQSATLSAGGAATYTWNPGGLIGGTVIVSPAITTIYTATGTTLFGCINTATVTLSVTPTPTVIAAVNPTAICIGNSATLTANGASTYTWNPGALTGSNVTVNPILTTVYSVTGTTGGCTNTQTVLLVVNPLPTLIAGGSPNPVCQGASVTLTVSGASTYTWNPGALTGSNVVVSPTINTSYTAVGNSSLGCNATVAVNVTVNPLPTLTLSSTNSSICAGSSVTLTANGANSYTWLPGGTNGNTLAVTPTITTTYTVTGLSLAGCSSTAVITVTVNAIPVLTLAATATNVCIGSSATLTASGANTYTWNPGPLTGNTIVITPTTNITYTVLGQSIGGCTAVAQITIVANPGPTISASSSSSVICSGSTVSLTANGATSYTWNPGALPGSLVTVTPSVNTTYTVNGTNGGCVASAVISISVNPSPTVTASASPSVKCIPGTTTLTATGALVYSWLPPALTGSSIVQNPTVTTTYTVIGSNGTCTNSAMVTVTVNPGPSLTITASPTIICSGSTATLTASGAINYQWQPGGTNGPTLAVSPTVTTTYTLGGTVGGCPGFTTITMSVSPTPTIIAFANPTVVCAGSNVSLTASGGATYTWNPGAVVGGTITVNPTITTIYTVTAQNISGCSATAAVNVSVNPLPNLTITPTPTSICIGGSATITVAGANTYTWLPGGSTAASIAVSPTVTTTYSVIGTDLIGCSTTQTAQLIAYPLNPTITAVSNPTSICFGSSATITAGGAVNYTWNPGGMTGSVIVVNPTVTTTYSIDGTNGCGSGSTTINLMVNPVPQNVTAAVSGTITCATPSVNLLGSTTSTNVAYLWNGPSGYTSAVQNPTGIAFVGNYTFTVFDLGGGCSAAATVAVTSDSSIPTVTATFVGTITCANPIATLQAVASTTNAGFVWTGPGSFTSAAQNPTIAIGGNYTLTVTDLGNNCQTSTFVIVTTNTTVPITATMISATCNGTMANNDGMIVASGFIPADHYDYVIGMTYTGSATYTSAAVIPITGILTNTLVNPMSPTPYTVRFFGANGCTKDTTMFLTPTTCITNTVFGLAKAVAVMTLNTNGSYDVQYTIVAKNSGMVDLNNVVLIENLSNTFPAPTTFSFITTPTVTTVGSSLTIDGTFDGTLQTVMTNTTTSILKANSTDTIKFTVNVVPNGIFGPFNNSVIGYASPTVGTTFGDSTNTGLDPDPDLDGMPTNNNLPTVLNLTPNLFFGLTKVGTASEKLGDDTYDVSYTVTVHNLGNDTLYNVNVYDTLFNKTIRQPATYTIKSGPVISGTGSLTANGSYDGNNNSNLIMAPSKMPPNTTASIAFMINVTLDTVSVLSNSSNGSALSSLGNTVTDVSNNGSDPDTNDNGIWNESADNLPTIIVIPNSTLFIPNGFSPNADNKNDMWVIKGLPKGTKVTIFNRWGNKVYAKDDYDNTWDGRPNVSGTLGTDKLPQGTYYYILEFTDGKTKAANGFVVVQY
jgi:gliding motility-associated-like protein